jgi:hypothetical protein
LECRPGVVARRVVDNDQLEAGRILLLLEGSDEPWQQVRTAVRRDDDRYLRIGLDRARHATILR